MTIIKNDIVELITQKVTLNKKVSTQAVEGLLKIIKSSLRDDQEIIISGFGKFNLKEKKARIGRNPKTMKEYEISARKIVTFSPSKVFRQEINL